jgi:hypothetical protein
MSVFEDDEISCLDHRIPGNGLKPNAEKMKAVAEFPSPNDHPAGKRVAALRSSLWVVSFYKNYFANFAELATPIYQSLTNKTMWIWACEQE